MTRSGMLLCLLSGLQGARRAACLVGLCVAEAGPDSMLVLSPACRIAGYKTGIPGLCMEFGCYWDFVHPSLLD
jgi:hypothetical protein